MIKRDKMVKKLQIIKIKDNVLIVLKLYANINISQFATVRNLIKSMVLKSYITFRKHDKVKPIDERTRDKDVRIEHTNLDKPQSRFKFLKIPRL
jgi:hypothetical protein